MEYATESLPQVAGFNLSFPVRFYVSPNTYEEIESGIVGKGGDGGIDSIYLFVNDDLIHEDTDLSIFKRAININLFIVQSKTSPGFTEIALDRLISVTGDLLDLSKKGAEFQSVYNEGLIQFFELFRSVHNELGGSLPTLNVSFYYATKGGEVHPNVARKEDKLRETVKCHFSDAKMTLDFLGARELVQLARRAHSTAYKLDLAENPISSSGQEGFLCLVHLRDFYSFVIDEDGHLNRHIFESNVRDYQGRSQVNDEIQESLQERREGEDFWWLNGPLG